MSGPGGWPSTIHLAPPSLVPMITPLPCGNPVPPPMAKQTSAVTQETPPRPASTGALAGLAAVAARAADAPAVTIPTHTTTVSTAVRTGCQPIDPPASGNHPGRTTTACPGTATERLPPALIHMRFPGKAVRCAY